MKDLIDLLNLASAAAHFLFWLAVAAVALLALLILWIVASGRVTRWWSDRRERGLMRRLLAQEDTDLIGEPYHPAGALDALTPEQRAAGGARLLAAIRTLDHGLPQDATAGDIAALYDAPAHSEGDDR